MRSLVKKKLKAVTYMLNLCKWHGRIQGLSYPIEGLYWQLKPNVHHVLKKNKTSKPQKPQEKAK